MLCSLELARDSCGLDVALHLQHLQDNLTSLVFSVSGRDCIRRLTTLNIRALKGGGEEFSGLTTLARKGWSNNRRRFGENKFDSTSKRC